MLMVCVSMNHAEKQTANTNKHGAGRWCGVVQGAAAIPRLATLLQRTPPRMYPSRGAISLASSIYAPCALPAAPPLPPGVEVEVLTPAAAHAAPRISAAEDLGPLQLLAKYGEMTRMSQEALALASQLLKVGGRVGGRAGVPPTSASAAGLGRAKLGCPALPGERRTLAWGRQFVRCVEPGGAGAMQWSSAALERLEPEAWRLKLPAAPGHCRSWRQAAATR